jgi:hypothetical protein
MGSSRPAISRELLMSQPKLATSRVQSELARLLARLLVAEVRNGAVGKAPAGASGATRRGYDR